MTAPARPSRRRGRRVVAWAAAVLALLLAFGLFPQEPLRRWTEARLRAALGPRVHIGRLHVVPALLRVDAWEVRLGAPSFDAHLPHARLRLGPETFRGGGVSLRGIELDAPRLSVRAVADDAPDAAPWRGPLAVGGVRVRDGRFTYEAEGGATRVELRGLALDGALGTDALHASATGASLALPGLARPIELTSAEARARVASDVHLQLDGLEARTARSRLTARGALGGPGAWSYGLRFEGRVDLADAAAPLGRADLAGDVALEGHAIEEVAGPSFDVTLTAPRLETAGLAFDEATLQVERQGDGPTRAVARARMLGGTLEAHASLEDGTLDGHARARGLDARRAAPQVADLGGRIDAVLTARGRLDASLGVDLQARLDGRYARQATTLEARARGRVDVPARRVALAWEAASELKGAPDAALSALELRGQGRADGVLPPPVSGRVEGRARLRGVSADAPVEATFAGDVRAAGARVSARLDGQALGGSLSVEAETSGARFDRLRLRAEALDLGALTPGARGLGRLTFEARGPAAHLDGAGQVRVDGAGWRDAALGTIDAGVRLERGRPRFEAQARDLSARASGAFDDGSLRAVVELRDTPLVALGQALGEALDGRATARAEVALPLARPADARLDARVSALELSQPAAVRALQPFELRHSERRTHVRALLLEGPFARLAAEGSYGGAAPALDLRATATLALERAPLPEGARASGSVEAEVDVAGPLHALRATGFLATRDVSATLPGAPELRLDDSLQALDGDALAVRGLTLNVAGGSLTLDGRLPWAALHPRARRDPQRLGDDENARLVLDWREIDAAALLRARAPESSATLVARLAGRAELQGGLAAPSELAGRILLPETALVAADVPLTLAPAELRLDAGRLSTDALRLTGRDGSLDAKGALDLRARTLAAELEGTLDLRVLSPLLGEAALGGRGELAALVSGPLDAPRLHGTLLAKDGSLRLRALRQPLTDIDAWLTFDDQALALRELSARLGGGDVRGSGTARLDGRRLADVDLRLEGRGVGLHYPAGLRSRLDADVRLTGRGGAWRLSGDVRAERGLFDLDAVAEASLFGPAVKAEPSPLLRSFALDLNVATTQPLRVRRTTESLADLLATAQLTLRGDLETPAPRGRVDLLPGGRATLLNRELAVQRGRLTYDGTWDPTLDLEATLKEPLVVVSEAGAPEPDANDDARRGQGRLFDTLLVAGTLEAPRLTLRREDGGETLGPDQSLSLLATGRLDDTLASSGGLVAAEQAAALLAGRLTRTLTRGLSPLGLDEIAIEPQLAALDADRAGARFTFARRLGPGSRVIYSHSLRAAEDRFVKLELGPLWRVRASVERREAGKFGYTAGQKLEFGGDPAPGGQARETRPADERVRLAAVDFEGDRPLPEAELLRALDLRAGRRVGPWDVLDAADGLRARLVEAGHLEAEVSAWLDGARARVSVSAGPRYDWRVEGFSAPASFARRLRAALFEDEALELGQGELRRALVERGHLRARVTPSVETRPDGRTLVFAVEPGPRLRLAGARFPGASAFSGDELLRRAGGIAGVLADPQAARAAWLAAYHEIHFLAARVDPPRLDERDGRVTLEARIDEGPRARVASLALQGGALADGELERASGLAVGAAYSDASALQAAQRLREVFVGLGHPEARVVAEAVPAGHDFDVLLRLDAGPRVEIGALEVLGARRTREALLRARSGLAVGRPLDVRALAVAEGRLLALGTLASARVSPAPDAPGTLRIDVRERAPLAFDYRLRHDDEDGASLETDAELRHLFGRAAVLGGRYRLGRDQRNARAFINWPLGPGPLTLSFSRLAEDLPRSAFPGDTVTNLRVQRELQVQQALETFRPWVLFGGYRFKRVTLLPLQPDPIDLAALSLSLARETRDNPLDPRHGRFYGLDVELAPAWLESDLTFVKGSAQAFFARSRGALTWAQGYRLALGRGLGGQRLTSTERFRAGGAFTVRGFASDSLGPDFLGTPAGGEALLVLNQELRWRHASGLGTAVFYDAGNVYARASELRGLRLRHALGVGLRYTSPFGLLRVDFGFPLARRADEKSWRWFFTFGQAF